MVLIESDSLLGTILSSLKDKINIKKGDAIEAAIGGAAIGVISVATGNPWEVLPWGLSSWAITKLLLAGANRITGS